MAFIDESDQRALEQIARDSPHRIPQDDGPTLARILLRVLGAIDEKDVREFQGDDRNI